MPRPSDSSRFYHQQNSGWGIILIIIIIIRNSKFKLCSQKKHKFIKT
jgi:hypothetical protein